MRFLLVVLFVTLTPLAFGAEGTKSDEWQDQTLDQVRAKIIDTEKRLEEAKTKLEKNPGDNALKSALAFEQSRLKSLKGDELPVVEKNTALRSLLSQRATLSLYADFDTVVDKFIDEYRIRIRTEDYVKKPYLNIKGNDVPITTLLDSIAQQCDASWHVRYGYVFLSPLHIPEDAWKHEIEKQLSKRITFDFVDTSFDEAVNFLRTVSCGVTIIVSPKFENPKNINLHVTDMSLNEALKWICRLSGAEMTMIDKAIFIYPKGRNGVSFAAPRDFQSEQLAKAKAEGEAWKQEVFKGLNKRVTFEFTEQTLADSLNFLNTLTKLNIIIDPALAAKGATPITLRVSDMALSDALTWICRLADLEWELRDQALFIIASPDAQPAEQSVKADDKKSAGGSGRLRVKLANGNEIEADESILNQNPGMAAAVLDQFIDPAKDGLLTYRLAKDLAAAMLEKIKPVIAKVSQKAKLDFDEKTELLLVTGDDASELRRIATVLRELNIASKAPATGPGAPISNTSAVKQPAHDAEKKTLAVASPPAAGVPNFVLHFAGTEGEFSGPETPVHLIQQDYKGIFEIQVWVPEAQEWRSERLTVGRNELLRGTVKGDLKPKYYDFDTHLQLQEIVWRTELIDKEVEEVVIGEDGNPKRDPNDDKKLIKQKKKVKVDSLPFKIAILKDSTSGKLQEFRVSHGR